MMKKGLKVRIFLSTWISVSSWPNGICFTNYFVDIWTDILMAYTKYVPLVNFILLPITNPYKVTGNDYERKPSIIEPISRGTVLYTMIRCQKSGLFFPLSTVVSPQSWLTFAESQWAFILSSICIKGSLKAEPLKLNY